MTIPPDMLEPIEILIRFVGNGDDAGLDEAFADSGVVIVENFAPFVFEGPDAVERWREGFGRHRDVDGLSDLHHGFAPAQDFARDGRTAYFVLPTTWTGKAHGRPFSEDGGWAFVLEEHGDRWRIRCYAWAVTAKR
jgi:hypothetical protein